MQTAEVKFFEMKMKYIEANSNTDKCTNVKAFTLVMNNQVKIKSKSKSMDYFDM